MYRFVTSTGMLTSEESFVCAICLEFESTTTPDWFVTTPNGHVFHFNRCLKEWLERGETRCPLCNENIVLKRLTRLFGIDPSSRRDLQGNGRASTSAVNNNGEIAVIDAENDNDSSTLSMEDLLVSSRDPDYSFKIVLLGDAGVGKSSLLYRYTTGVFSFAITSTVGCDVSFKTIAVGGKVIKLSVWDTGGQERFQSISKNFVRNAHGVILVYSYDEQDAESLESIKKWIDFVDENGIPGVAMLLVGNKADIPEGRRVITTEHGHEVALNLGLQFFETSARDEMNIDAVFRALAVETLQRVETKQLEYRSPEQDKENRVRLREAQNAQQARKWC